MAALKWLLRVDRMQANLPVLNQLTGNRRTAKVSKTPGRTQLMNFFDVRTGGRMVDLPGYGYAKAGKEAQKTGRAR